MNIAFNRALQAGSSYPRADIKMEIKTEIRNAIIATKNTGGPEGAIASRSHRQSFTFP
jgi:hypothetical protein